MAARIFVTSANRSYLPGLLALARSFAMHCPLDRLVLALPASEECESQWTRPLLETGIEIMKFDEIGMRQSVGAWLKMSRSRHTLGTFVKLWLPSRLGKPFWWIDADVIVRGYIDDPRLTTARLSCALAPHPLPRSSCFSDLSDRNIATLVRRYAGEDLDRLHRPGSLNGGLAWFNSAEFEHRRLRSVSEVVLREFGGALIRADESVFNLLGPRYGIGILSQGLQEFVSVGDDSAVKSASELSAATVHFTGPLKPWMAGYPLAWPVELYRGLLGNAAMAA
jgi:hypothetical protein